MSEEQIPAQPDTFEGDVIAAQDVKVAGAAGDGRVNPHLHLGDEVVIVGKAIVSKIEHKETEKRGLVRTQTATLSEVFILEDELDAADLIHKLRADRKRQMDELLGTPPLPGVDGEPPEGDTP